MRTTGKYETASVGGERVRAFVPLPLPPEGPTLRIDGELAEQTRIAEEALVRLEIAGEMVPSLDWFIYAFVRKEAVLSSQIEGTQATLMDLFNFEARDKTKSAPETAVEEVCNYLEALEFARRQLQDSTGLPLSMRLLNRAHELLLQGVRGSNKLPGEVRRSQNWIGGLRPGSAAYIPPPPNALPRLLSDFESYIHSNDAIPPLIRAGLLHAQFETIHPYLDGNGRIGRLLITLLLEHWQLLTRPLLYLSLFFKRHRQEYYRHLNAVRRNGDWEGWLNFFLEGVSTTADEAASTARDLFSLIARDRQRLLQQPSVNLIAIQLFERLPGRPIVRISGIVQTFETTKPTAARSVRALEEAGILVETTGKKRARSYAYQAYLDRLRVGTELEE